MFATRVCIHHCTVAGFNIHPWDKSPDLELHLCAEQGKQFIPVVFTSGLPFSTQPTRVALVVKGLFDALILRNSAWQLEGDLGLSVSWLSSTIHTKALDGATHPLLVSSPPANIKCFSDTQLQENPRLC